MSRFRLHPTPLGGLQVIERLPLGDSRGWLERVFCQDDLREVGLAKTITQINRTLTQQAGSVRGMHFQFNPHLETKIVSCLRGQIFDVAVDLRVGSPTYLQWHGEVLSADNHRTLYIPDGFAHGFQTLTDDCELLYLHTQKYVPDAEGALNALDPRLAIAWPLPITEMSARDKSHPMLTDDFVGLQPASSLPPLSLF